jgi:hypothetical protein
MPYKTAATNGMSIHKSGLRELSYWILDSSKSSGFGEPDLEEVDL